MKIINGYIMYEQICLPKLQPMNLVPNSLINIGEYSLSTSTSITNGLEELSSAINKMSLILCLPFRKELTVEPITIIPIKEVSYNDAKEEIITYIKSKEGEKVYISELAEEFSFDIDLIIQVVADLKENGEVNIDL